MRYRRQGARETAGGSQEGLDGRESWMGQDGGKAGSAPPYLSVPPSCLLQSFVNRGPIDHVPPSVDVVRTPVLIFQVVGVLPHVDAEHDFLAFHDRAVLIGTALDRELVAAADHPCPAASKPAHRRLLHF